MKAYSWAEREGARTGPAHTTCAGVRSWFSGHVAGRLGVTERALLEVHLMHCVACRLELQQHTLADVRRPAQRTDMMPTLVRVGTGFVVLVLLGALVSW